MSRGLDVPPEVEVLLRGDGQVPGQGPLPRPQATGAPLPPLPASRHHTAVHTFVMFVRRALFTESCIHAANPWRGQGDRVCVL